VSRYGHIKLKIKQGEQAVKKYWNYFAIFYLILVPIVILVEILLGVGVFMYYDTTTLKHHNTTIPQHNFL